MIYDIHYPLPELQPSQLVLAWPALEEQRWQLNYEYWEILQLNSRNRNGNDAMSLIKRSPRVADTDRSQVETTARGSGNRRSWKFCVCEHLCVYSFVCFEVTLEWNQNPDWLLALKRSRRRRCFSPENCRPKSSTNASPPTSVGTRTTLYLWNI